MKKSTKTQMRSDVRERRAKEAITVIVVSIIFDSSNNITHKTGNRRLKLGLLRHSLLAICRCRKCLSYFLAPTFETYETFEVSIFRQNVCRKNV